MAEHLPKRSPEKDLNVREPHSDDDAQPMRARRREADEWTGDALPLSRKIQPMSHLATNEEVTPVLQARTEHLWATNSSPGKRKFQLASDIFSGTPGHPLVL